jgi:hypothetical protein
MAKEFPHVEVLGIDRPDDGITARACDMPSNCRFEPRPDYEFLEEDRFKNQFDLIHMRFVAGGVSAYFLDYYTAHLCCLSVLKLTLSCITFKHVSSPEGSLSSLTRRARS